MESPLRASGTRGGGGGGFHEDSALGNWEEFKGAILT